MKSHFFDIDVILKLQSQVWIVDRDTPSIPLVKISKSDFNLIRNGIYKGKGDLISFAGDDYWIPKELSNKLKIKSKTNNVDFSNIGFSMQEFMNKELIENMDFELKLDNLLHLKNTTDDIFIICSRNSKTNYELMISKLEEKLQKVGLKIKKYYFISETFYNRDQDEVALKKVRLLLQHCLGYKTEGEKFTDEKLDQYDEVYYYDDESNSIEFAKSSNVLLKQLISNSEQNLSKILKQLLQEKEHSLVINYSTDNKMNKFLTDRVKLEFSNLIKKFESFVWKF